MLRAAWPRSWHTSRAWLPESGSDGDMVRSLALCVSVAVELAPQMWALGNAITS